MNIVPSWDLKGHKLLLYINNVLSFCFLFCIFVSSLEQSSGWAIVITLFPSLSIIRHQQLFVNTLEATVFTKSWWNFLRMFAPVNLGQVRYWVTWGQKLGHQVRSKDNIVNTLEVTFFKQSSWIMLKMFVLMISRSSSKLGHWGSKIRSKENLEHFWSKSSSILLEMFVLMISRSSLKLGHLGSKSRSPGQINRKPY